MNNKPLHNKLQWPKIYEPGFISSLRPDFVKSVYNFVSESQLSVPDMANGYLIKR